MQKCKQVPVLCLVVFISLMVAASGYAADVEKIDINTATPEQLTQLTGIGASHAAAIVAYREKNGPFQKPEDLMNVPRIGEKTFEKNRSLITVQKPEKRSAKK